MKVAVCIFGLCRGRVEENLNRLKKHFPHDYFFGTWDERKADIESLLPGVDFMTTPEPTIDYHPVLDVTENLYPKDRSQPIHKQQNFDQTVQAACRVPSRSEHFRHRTKQILGHAYMLSQIPTEYDMIIRTRFDVILSDNVDFGPFLNESYNKNKAIGFATFPAHISSKFNTLQKHNKDRTILPDFLIMHKRDMFDIQYAHKLNNDKELHIAEIGWYQILSQPFGGNHVSVVGGIKIDRETS